MRVRRAIRRSLIAHTCVCTCVALAAIVVFPSAAATETPAMTVAPLSGGRVIEVAAGLLVVVAAIAVCAWILRRTLRGVGGHDGALRVVGGLSLGARERVMLLQVGERQLLLGISPGRIQTLYVLEETVEAPASAGHPDQGFGARLSAAIDRIQRRTRHEPRT